MNPLSKILIPTTDKSRPVSFAREAYFIIFSFNSRNLALRSAIILTSLVGCNIALFNTSFLWSKIDFKFPKIVRVVSFNFKFNSLPNFSYSLVFIFDFLDKSNLLIPKFMLISSLADTLPWFIRL